ncbi:MAG: hypothetical protein WKG07_33505, partial [Hymenobacter sp.]
LKPTRLEAAKRLASRFVGRAGDRLAPGGLRRRQAYSLAPLTTDYDLLRESLRQPASLGMIANDGTAIGTALGVATNRLRDSHGPLRVCILLSDGENTAGSLDPLLAAQPGPRLRHPPLHHRVGPGRLRALRPGLARAAPATCKPASTKPPCASWPRPPTASFFRATDNAALQARCSSKSTGSKSRTITASCATATPRISTGLTWRWRHRPCGCCGWP